MSVLNDVCTAIARKVSDAYPEIDARPHPGGALTTPAFVLEVVSFPQRTTARKRDIVLRGVLVLADVLTEEAVRQGRDYMEDGLSAAIEGRAADYDDLVDHVVCGEWAEATDTYQETGVWSITCEITVLGRTS